MTNLKDDDAVREALKVASAAWFALLPAERFDSRSGDFVRITSDEAIKFAEHIAALLPASTAPVSGPPTIPAGMKPWAGGDRAPADWDGGPVYCDWRFGDDFDTDGRYSVVSNNIAPESWCRSSDPERFAQIIAYTPTVSAEASPVSDTTDDPAGVREDQAVDLLDRVQRALASRGIWGRHFALNEIRRSLASTSSNIGGVS